MHISIPLFIAFTGTAFAAPTPSPQTTAAASAKNVYLSTCTTRSLLTDEVSSSAILFSGPASSTQPTDIGTVSSLNAIPWAGFTRRARLDGGTQHPHPHFSIRHIHLLTYLYWETSTKSIYPFRYLRIKYRRRR
jgi:hypothetical protein